MSTAAQPLTVEAVDELVSAVAELLSVPAVLDADMGFLHTLQIYLGERLDESTGRPVTRAGIDPDDPSTVWWIDFEVGDHQKFSTLDATAAPEDVARWITTALQEDINQGQE